MSQVSRVPSKPKRTVYIVFWFDQAAGKERSFELPAMPEFKNGFCCFEDKGKPTWLSGCIRVVQAEV